MIDPNKNCPFCNGEVIEAEYTYGGGIQTMSMMLDNMLGMYSRKIEKPDHCKNGIQLADGNKLCFDNSACEYTLLAVDIKYCPFCGKELSADD